MTDPDGETTTSTITVEVTPVNDVPTAPDYGHKTPEETPVSGKVVGTDPDGDTLTYTGGTPPAHGTVTINPDGSYIYTPGKDFNGKDTFEVIVTDPDGETTTSTITVEVTPVNDPVDAQNDSYTVGEDGSVVLDLLGNDSAPDGGLKITSINGITLTGNPQSITVPNGRVDIAADGTMSFVPNANYHGPMSFDYSVEDADGDTDTATVNIAVTSVNDAPTTAVTLPNETGKDGGAVRISTGGGFTDVDGDKLTYTASGLPPGLSIDPTTGLITGTLDPSASQGGSGKDGIYTITVTAKDPSGATAAQTFELDVSNPPPVAVDDTAKTHEDTPVSGNVLTDRDASGKTDVDPDGDTLVVTGFTIDKNGDGQPDPFTAGSTATLTAKDGTAIGKLVINADGSYTFTPALNYNGPVPVATYTISDKEGGTATATLTINVDSVDEPVTVTVPVPDHAASKPDGKTTDHVVFESGLGDGSATNANDTQVVSSFTIDCPDGLADSDAVTLTRGDGTIFKISKSDLEALNTASYKVSTQYGELLLNGYSKDPTTGLITIKYTYTLTKAPHNNTGNGIDLKDDFTIVAKDRDGHSSPKGDISIKIVDDAPQAKNDTKTVNEDDAAAVTGNVTGSTGATSGDVVDSKGADGATVTGVQAGVPSSSNGHVADSGLSGAGASVTVKGTYGILVIHADGSYTYTLQNGWPATQGLINGQVAEDIFSYTLTDGDGDQSTAKLTINVHGTNDVVKVTVPNDQASSTPDANTGDHVVFESGLNDGTAKNPANTVVHSQFSIDAKDGLAASGAVVFRYTDATGANSLTLSKAELESLNDSQKTIVTQYGTLVLNGYTVNPTTGEITVKYTYTLDKAANVSGAGTLDNIGISVTDRNGDESSSEKISIKIVDDAPIAVDQNGVSLPEGGLSVGYTGVAWSAGTSNLLDNDKQGADGARVGSIKYIGANGSEKTLTIASGKSITVDTQYGKLTVHSDGTWSYTSNGSVAHGTDAGKTDDFSYSLVDRDSINPSDWAKQPITVTDIGLTLGAPESTTLDEDDLVLGTDKNKGATSVSGALNVGKGVDAIDTKLSIDAAPKNLTSGGVGVEYVLSADGHTLTAYVGTGRAETDKVFAVEITDPHGNPGYTFTLHGKLDHPAGSGENKLDLVFGFETKETNSVDDSVGKNFTVSVVDDIPVISENTSANVALEVDESKLGASGSASTSLKDLFVINFGADGKGTAHYELGLKGGATTGVDSGLVDTATGSPVLLSISGNTVTGTVLVNGVLTTVFTLKVTDAANGVVELTQYRSMKHGDALPADELVQLAKDAITLKVTATDGDGDPVSSSNMGIGDRISFKDDVPVIGTPENSTIDESALIYGSKPDAGALTKTGSLHVTTGADSVGTLANTKFDDPQSKLNDLWLKSGGKTLVYTVSADGHTLTAMAEGKEVFVVTITNPGTVNAGYKFELKASLDHGKDATKDLNFAFTVTDGDGDSKNSNFNVTVVDDKPDETPVKLDVVEDSTGNTPANSFNTTADADVSLVEEAKHGQVTIDPDTGRVTYVPNHNYSGKDTFTYRVKNYDESYTDRVVEVTVDPVADAPIFTKGASPVSTYEDKAIALGLNAPQVEDDADQSDGVDGDSPEKLGPITLSGLPEGAILYFGVDKYEVGSSGTVTIILTDGPHHANADGLLKMTTEDFNKMTVLPPAESSKDFTVKAEVTSYEVKSDNTPIAGKNGASTIVEVPVEVKAVTDPIDLKIKNSNGDFVDASTKETAVSLPSFAEESSFNLSSHLQALLGNADDNTGPDVDGSEERWITISNLSAGSVVTVMIDGVPKEVTPVNGVYTILCNGLNSSTPTLPEISIKAPDNFSGNMLDVQVTLHSIDRDVDGSSFDGALLSDTVHLNLHVTPVAGDVEVKGVTTREDTAVNFLAGVSVTDKSSDGEVINSVSFTVPVGGWVVSQPTAGVNGVPSSGWSVIGDGKSGTAYTITFDDSLNETQRELVLKGFAITPPAHSSKDASITLSITSTDSIEVNGKVEINKQQTSHTLVIEVTPVAEKDTVDSDKKDGVDVGLTIGHIYQNAGKEDEWFALNIKDGFQLKDGWFNSDGDEQTFARLIPTVTGGEGVSEEGPAIGSSFQYFDGKVWVEQVYDGKTPIDIPVQYLDTLQFKAPPNFSGKFSIAVQAVTRDYDDDREGTGVFDEAISGNATLENILINPVAEDFTLALNGGAAGKEDTQIKLNINPTSSDPSETFELKISNIPPGATLYYGKLELMPDSNGVVKIPNYKGSEGLFIKPPVNSNESFNLEFEATLTDRVIIDGITVDSPPTTKKLTVEVNVDGVADMVTISTLKPTYSEAELDAESKQVWLKDLLTVKMDDADGSEALTFTIKGLPAGFNLVPAGTWLVRGTGVEREWLLTQDQLANVKISVPNNFSGEVKFSASAVSTERIDGNTWTGDKVDVSFVVKPSAEAEATTSGALVEDVISSLKFGIVHKNGDTDETLTKVWIKVADAGTGLPTDPFTLYLGTGTGAKTLAQALADKTITKVTRGADEYYELTGAQAKELAARGKQHLDGSLGKFHYEYEVQDDSGSNLAGIGTKEGSGDFAITATPVTDAVDLLLESVVGGDNSAEFTTVDASGIVTVNLNAVSDDKDGSEQVTRVLISGVPEGVKVVGAELSLDGKYWVLVYEDASIGENGLALPIQFDFGTNAKPSTHDITFEVQVMDRGTESVRTDSVSWNVKTTYTPPTEEDPGKPTPPPVTKWDFKDNLVVNEDQPNLKLKDLLDATVADSPSGKSSVLTVTVDNLPTGVTVSGMTMTEKFDAEGKVIQTIWTQSIEVPAGEDAQAKLDELLNSITVTIPKDSNENNAPGKLKFDASLSTSVEGSGDRDVKETAKDGILVAPVTDPAELKIVVTPVKEGTKVIPVTVSVNPGDKGYGSIVGGKLYLQLVGDKSSAGLIGGSLWLPDGITEIKPTQVVGVDGIPDGLYYLIPVNERGQTELDLTYRLEETKPGSVVFKGYVQSKEDENASLPDHKTGIVTKEAESTGSVVGGGGEGQVEIINNGVEIGTKPISVMEEKHGAALADRLIELTGVDGLSVTLKDIDGSETIGIITLSNVPEGFLVYVEGADGTRTLASNLGADGLTNNTWLLSSEGGLPPKVFLLPPNNWSGTLSEVTLNVESGETKLDAKQNDSQKLGNITIAPVADGLTLNTSVAFGKENSVIALNLNASMKDPVKITNKATGGPASPLTPVDNSIETTTIKITGLGAHASFYVGAEELFEGKQITKDGVTYTFGVKSDVDGNGYVNYTISGIPQSLLDQLGFKQAMDDLKDQDAKAGMQIGIEAWTVESFNGHASDKVFGVIDLSITKQQPTGNADSLLWTGSKIDAGAGDDTVQLRSGEIRSGAELAAKLTNVEILDLTVHGANSITGLSAANVFAMTDSRHMLTIKGTAEDLLQLSNGWTPGSSAGTYTSIYQGSTVTVKVDGVTVSNGSGARASSFSMPSWDDLLSTDSGSISLDNVLPAPSTQSTTLPSGTASSFSTDSTALYAPLPQSALDDELHQLGVVHY
ncbi:tandem-95 repeat protein [Comamonas sp.]|uniref:tandem-95 repeat protein n=1 Tax=Comamonas sp. TaxID=34028 RepID=UPI002FC635E4